MKKAIVAILVIVFLAAVAFGIWYYFSLTQNGEEIALFDDGSGRRSFLPFGDGGEETREDVDVDEDGVDQEPDFTDDEVFATDRPILRQLSRNPVSGAVFAINKDAVEVVRYVERGTGHIFEIPTFSTTQQRISNTTIPNIQEVVWGADDRIIIRYLNDVDEIETFSARIIPPEELLDIGQEEDPDLEVVGELLGRFLQRNILSVVTDTNGEKIFYTTKGVNGSVGTVSGFDGSNQEIIFSSPLKELLPEWSRETTITLTTKPSAGVPGYMFFLSGGSGTLSNALNDIPGLTTLTSPDAKTVIYSANDSLGIDLKMYRVDSGKHSSLSISTFPEKCVWNKTDLDIIYCAVPKLLPRARLPDDWYLGLVSFSDSIWRINIETSEAEQVLDPTEEGFGGLEIDATRLDTNDSGKNLIFVNKKDLTPWMLNMPEDPFDSDDEETEEGEEGA